MQGAKKLAAQRVEARGQPLDPADQNIVRPGPGVLGGMKPHDFTQAPANAVANNGIARLFRDGEAEARRQDHGSATVLRVLARGGPAARSRAGADAGPWRRPGNPRASSAARAAAAPKRRLRRQPKGGAKPVRRRRDGTWRAFAPGLRPRGVCGRERGGRSAPCGRRRWPCGRESHDGACARFLTVDRSASRVCSGSLGRRAEPAPNVQGFALRRFPPATRSDAALVRMPLEIRMQTPMDAGARPKSRAAL